MQSDIQQFESALQALVKHHAAALGAVRANRPTTKLIEDIRVEYYNQMMTIKQLGSIMVVPPREILVHVWDKGALPAVARGIETAQLGFGVVIEDQTLHLNVPPLTDERRAAVVKAVKAMTEKERISVRSMRDEINKKIKAAESDEDMQFTLKENVQKIVDTTNKQLDDLLVAKIKEINE